MDEEPFDKDICGINFAAMFAYLDERGLDTSLICKRTGLERNFLTNRREYIDLPTGTIIFSTVKEILGEKDPMIFYDIGKEAPRLRSYGVLLDIGQSLGNVEESVKFLPRFNRKFADLFEMVVYNVKQDRAVVVIHYKKKKYDGAWIFDQCAWNRGNIAGIPAFWGLPPMEIEEELCRFSLDEVFRDYAFMGHALSYENGHALFNGQEFAVPVAIGVEEAQRSLDKLQRMNPMLKRDRKDAIFTNKGFTFFEDKNDSASGDAPHGMLITREIRVSDRMTLKKGQIFGAPYCRFDIQWQQKGKLFKSMVRSTVSKFRDPTALIQNLEEELEINIAQKQELIAAKENLEKAHEDLKRYANDLESMVEERTKELRETQAQLIEAEKRVLEHRITGGFAHEMRNALTGAQLEFKTTLNYKGQGKPSAEILKESATNLLKNISVIHEKYNIPRGEIATLLLPELKTIAEIADHLSQVHAGVSSDLDRGLSITTQIRDYARMSELKPGSETVDIVPLLKSYGDRYRQDFERLGISYSLEGQESAVVKADETHINSIFSNLILNARDALEEIDSGRSKEIKVKVETKENETGSLLVITVTDTGPGIPEENLGEIFEPFYSTKPTTGTGLGLGVVRRLVQLYDGTIEMTSAVDKGTAFKVTFLGLKPIG